MDPRNKTALVTGGASGLGAATVRMLAQRGAQVVIADRAVEPGKALAAELGSSVAFAETDVTSEAAMQAAIDLARKQWGGLHIAIGCAGLGTATRVLGKGGPFPLDLFQLTINVNLVGMFNMLRLSAAAMADNAPENDERGVVVMTASIAAFDGQVGQAAYSASKAGIVGMTLPIARELARNGVRVMTIAPGTFDTPMLRMLPEEARQALGAQVPFPSRLGNPPEYAQLALHIVENQMLNGECIRLDGALRMPPR